MKGAPLLLAIMAGALIALFIPHFVVGKMIQRRIAQFTARFPDAIELMVRGLRSGLPISETVGVVGRCHGRSEHTKHAIAQVGHQRAAVVEDGVRHQGEVLVQDVDDRCRVALLRERRETA